MYKHALICFGICMVYVNREIRINKDANSWSLSKKY